MKLLNWVELASIQGELEGLAMGMKWKDFNKDGVIKSLKELAKKIKRIRKEEPFEK